jgi:hypothetical protein
MRQLLHFFTYNWRPKLGSLVVATLLWLVIKHGIAYAPTLPPPPALGKG